MGTDANEAVGMVLNVRSFKVHRLMCTELMKLVDRISRIFPEIEAARPRSSSGILTLSLLNGLIEKAKLLLQHCSESSKLYLALTGESIRSKCTKSRDLFEEKLSQIREMVPVILAAEISQIVEDLSMATFVLDPYEEEAGNVIREIILKGSSTSNSMESSEVKAFQLATLRLNITSATAILIEKRSIRKLLVQVGETDPRKKTILMYFLNLLKKYGNSIILDQPESTPSYQASFAMENSGNASLVDQSAAMESHTGYRQYAGERNMLMRAVPPDEFRCPLSSKLMYDPVVIASGKTFERMWIQKWFGEGNVTCPKTYVTLADFSMTPNVSMKELISKWCAHNGVVISDPCAESEAQRVWDTSFTSIASLGSSMNDLRLQIDFSNISLGSVDTSFSSDSLRTKAVNVISSVDNDHSSDKFQSYSSIPETDLEFLSKLGELSWESQCKTVEDVKNTLRCNDRACYSLTSENFVEPLSKFLRDSRDCNDTNAQRDGFQLLSTFVNKNRKGTLSLREDTFYLLASFLDSEVTEEVLSIIEILSSHADCRSKIMSSGAAVSILRALDSQTEGFREQALKILCNLSSSHDLCSQIASLDCIPKLVPLMGDGDLAGKCVFIMKNLCNAPEGRASIAETSGCIASIVELLENGSSNEQELAVGILLSLCCQRVEYCQLVMDEGVVPPLVIMSVNGTGKAKGSAHELLRQLRDVKYEPEPNPAVDPEPAKPFTDQTTETKPSKRSGFFARKISMFSRKR